MINKAKHTYIARPINRYKTAITSGFTLIEISIVLVVIGLIVGGILVGAEMINAAAIRSQISQIEKYNTAVNTFRGKYGGIPGDLNAVSASMFGFVARSGVQGRGDGNGLLEAASGANIYAWSEGNEMLFFWEDLSSANLIDGIFNTYTDNGPINATPTSTPSLGAYMPTAKLGNGNYVYVFGGSPGCCAGNWTWNNGTNYFGMSTASLDNSGTLTSTPGLTVQQAYNIDKKIDDGVPETGNVTTRYVRPNGAAPTDFSTYATSPTSSTCSDAGGISNGVQQYSLASNANVFNCGLSFKFQ